MTATSTHTSRRNSRNTRYCDGCSASLTAGVGVGVGMRDSGGAGLSLGASGSKASSAESTAVTSDGTGGGAGGGALGWRALCWSLRSRRARGPSATGGGGGAGGGGVSGMHSRVDAQLSSGSECTSRLIASTAGENNAETYCNCHNETLSTQTKHTRI